MGYQLNWEYLHHFMGKCGEIVSCKGESEGIRKARRQRMVMIWRLTLWVMLMSLPVSHQASGCENFPSYSREKWESLTAEYEGNYDNCDYGYAITIPKGIVGRGGAHGFGMWLSSVPHVYIWVDGSANSLEWESPEQAANAHIEWIERDAQKMLSVQKSPIQIATLPAIRLVVRYVCPDASIKVKDKFIAVDQRGYAYTIGLSADAVAYEEYKPILEQLAETFRLRDNFCPSACEIYWPDDESSLASFEGEYVSCRFGYALSIPTGFVGHITSTLADSGLGFDILLSQQPRGIIKVDLSSNEPGWRTPDEVAEEELAWIEWSTRQLLSVQKEALTLVDLPAVRFTVRYVCSDDTIVVKDTFFVLHQERELVYKMWLLADDATYEEYKPILEQLVKTFQLREPSCE